MLGKMLENVRVTNPLVHCITNYVTANDCANALLAIGASPIMADDIADIYDITPISKALCINLGTLKKSSLTSMLEAGKIANKLSIPVVLDPVGAGASAFRTDSAKELINHIHFSAIRGNASEISALYNGLKNNRGVDANTTCAGNENIAKAFSKDTGATVIVSGDADYISNGVDTFITLNGHKMMRYVTGAGCMLTSIVGAFIGANKDDITAACIAAVCAMGLCGEKAYKRLGKNDGNATYRNYIIDELFHLNKNELAEDAKYEKH